jgi:hypothetical protein
MKRSILSYLSFFSFAELNDFLITDYAVSAPVTRVSIIKTTQKKRKVLPPELTNKKTKILTKVKRRAY